MEQVRSVSQQLPSQKCPFFATVTCSHNTTPRSDYMASLGLVTGWCVRHIRFASSWRPTRAATGHGATLSASPASLTWSGHNGLLSSDEAYNHEERGGDHDTRREDRRGRKLHPGLGEWGFLQRPFCGRCQL